MKKTIFATVLMVAAVLLIGCKPDNKSAVKSISFRTTELTLTPGQEQRLSLVVEPENAKYSSDAIVWASSDTTVAVVSNNGTVTALEKGTANITAKLGELTAVCAVSVKAWEENLTFTGFFYGYQDYAKDTAYYGNELDTIRSLSGELYYTKRIRVYVSLFTAGFYINDDYKFAGGNEGGVIEGYSSIYWAPAWANNTERGTVFILGPWAITDKYGDTLTQVIPNGKTNEKYIQNMELFLSNYLEGNTEAAYSVHMKAAADEGCEGATLSHYTYHTTAEGYSQDGYVSSYIPDLFIQDSYFEVEAGYAASSNLDGIAAHRINAKELAGDEVNETDYYAFGCYWHYDEAGQTITWVDKEVHWGETYQYIYNMESASSAPSRVRALKEIHEPASEEVTKKIQNAIHSVPADFKAIKK